MSATRLFHLDNPDEVIELPEGICMLAYRGSIAHGMYTGPDPDSIDDVDLMGFVIAERRHYLGLSEWGSRGTKEIKQGRYDAVFYELRKAFSLLLQGNPNILRMLWLRPEHYLYCPGTAKAIIDNRNLFVGKHIYDAFSGYAHGQLLKMETRDPAELRDYLAVTNELKFRGIHPNHKGDTIPYPDSHDPYHGEGLNAALARDEILLAKMAAYQKKGNNLGYLGDKRKQLVLQHGYDTKNAAHLIRLLRMAIEFLNTGTLQVHRDADAGDLLDIKRGKWTLDQVKQAAEGLFEQARIARDQSSLPEKANRELAEALLVGLLSEVLRLENSLRDSPIRP